MSENAHIYRRLIRDKYVSGHLSRLRDISMESIQSQFKSFDHYFGPHLPTNRSARILELGCGYGAFLAYLKHRGYDNVHGIDVSSEQVEAARRLGVANVEQAEALDVLKRSSGEFDCLIAIDVIEHFTKSEAIQVLQAGFQALNPGGRLILQSPNGESPFGGRYRYYDFTHEFSFTASSVRQVLHAVGFGSVAVYPTGPFAHGVASSIRVALWYASLFAMRVFLLAETGVLRGHVLSQNLIAVAIKAPSSAVSGDTA